MRSSKSLVKSFFIRFKVSLKIQDILDTPKGSLKGLERVLRGLLKGPQGLIFSTCEWCNCGHCAVATEFVARHSSPHRAFLNKAGVRILAIGKGRRDNSFVSGLGSLQGMPSFFVVYFDAKRRSLWCVSSHDASGTSAKNCKLFYCRCTSFRDFHFMLFRVKLFPFRIRERSRKKTCVCEWNSGLQCFLYFLARMQ